MKTARARPLTARVVPMDPEPALVVTPLASGAGTVERYRSAVAAGLAANVVQTPLIEVELGALAAGRYDVKVDETILEFDRWDHPQTARNPRRGLGATLSFAVR